MRGNKYNNISDLICAIELIFRYFLIMYVSVTGLKPKGLTGWIRFWKLTIPASKDAQKADGILHCAFNSRHGYQHTLTVWKSKKTYDELLDISSSFKSNGKFF